MPTTKNLLTEKKGALYIRVSTDKQEELSPDSQIKIGLEFAKKNNIYVAKEYIFRDDGISGRKADKRPEFQKMIGLAKSKEHPIDCIIVWKFSRFARNQEESIVYKSLLKKNNVDVMSVSEPLIDGPFGTLIERIIEWMDEYYSIRLSGEVIRGMTENAKRGKFQSDPPIGYMVKRSGFPEINPDTVKIPLLCKDYFLEGVRPYTIARRLNDMGFRTKRGNKFDARGIYYILQNPFYAGKSRWNYTGRGRTLKDAEDVIIADGNWKPLWDYDTYLLIQDKLNAIIAADAGKGRKKRDSSSCKHWLAGIVKCSTCGRSLSYCRSGAKGFQCWGFTKALCEKSHYISEQKLIDYIVQGLENLLLEDNITYTVVQNHAAPEQNVNDMVFFEKQLQAISEKEKRIKEAYRDGIDTLDEYKENKQLLQDEKKRITESMEELKNNTAAITVKEDLDNMMISNITDVINIIKDENADSLSKSEAIRSILDKIVFDKENTSFEFYLKLVL